MPYAKDFDVPAPVTTPPCIHFRMKASYYWGNQRDGAGVTEPDSCYCWCNLTQHVLGPDHQYVGRQQCTPERSCYKTTY
jgi:hypothetical protein